MLLISHHQFPKTQDSVLGPQLIFSRKNLLLYRIRSLIFQGIWTQMRSDLKSLKAKKLKSDLFGVCIKQAAGAKTTRIGADGGVCTEDKDKAECSSCISVTRQERFQRKGNKGESSVTQEKRRGRTWRACWWEEISVEEKGDPAVLTRVRRVGGPSGILEVDGPSRGEAAAGEDDNMEPRQDCSLEGKWYQHRVNIIFQ